MQRALGYLRTVLEKRQLNPCVDQRVIMQRIARKIERAAERLGKMSAEGTQAVTRCNGRVFENAEYKIVETKKEYVN